jgi:hypothetical protein
VAIAVGASLSWEGESGGVGETSIPARPKAFTASSRHLQFFLVIWKRGLENTSNCHHPKNAGKYAGRTGSGTGPC